jgi:hypothetical protein
MPQVILYVQGHNSNMSSTGIQQSIYMKKIYTYANAQLIKIL